VTQEEKRSTAGEGSPKLAPDLERLTARFYWKLGFMKRYRFYEGIWASFYSPGFYRSVAYEWSGLGLGYLFFVAAICSVIISSNLISQLVDAKADLPALTEQVPALIMKDGTLTTESNERVEILDPETQKPVAIIDPTVERPPSNALSPPGMLTFLAGKQLVIKRNPQNMTLDYSDFDDGRIKPERLRWWIALSLNVMMLVGPVILLVMFFLIANLYTFAFALLLWVFSGIMKRGFTYRDRIRLTAAALTPSFVVGAILDPSLEAGGIIWFSLVVLYLAFAVYCAVPPPGSETPDREESGYA
jgi:hypothetical protein